MKSSKNKLFLVRLYILSMVTIMLPLSWFNAYASADEPTAYCNNGRCGTPFSLLNKKDWRVETTQPQQVKTCEQELYTSTQSVINSDKIQIDAVPNYTGQINYNCSPPVKIRYASGSIRSKVTTAQFGRHGVLETELRFDYNSTQGPEQLKNAHSWFAYWMLPAHSDWPNNGEIDNFEWVSIYSPMHIGTGMHGKGYKGGGSTDKHNTSGATYDFQSTDVSRWHFYAMKWDIASDYRSGDLNFYIDGKLYYSQHLDANNTKRVFESSILRGFNPTDGGGFAPILNIAMGGWPGKVGKNDKAPLRMSVKSMNFYSSQPVQKLSIDSHDWDPIQHEINWHVQVPTLLAGVTSTISINDGKAQPCHLINSDTGLTCANTVDISSLVPGQLNHYAINAKAASGDKAAQVTDTFTVPLASCLAPNVTGRVYIGNSGNLNAYLSWQPVPGAVSYKVYGFDKHELDSVTNTIEGLSDPSTMYHAKDKKLGPSSDYIYYVVSLCQGGSRSKMVKGDRGYVDIRSAYSP